MPNVDRQEPSLLKSARVSSYGSKDNKCNEKRMLKTSPIDEEISAAQQKAE